MHSRWRASVFSACIVLSLNASYAYRSWSSRTRVPHTIRKTLVQDTHSQHRGRVRHFILTPTSFVHPFNSLWVHLSSSFPFLFFFTPGSCKLNAHTVPIRLQHDYGVMVVWALYGQLWTNNTNYPTFLWAFVSILHLTSTIGTTHIFVKNSATGELTKWTLQLLNPQCISWNPTYIILRFLMAWGSRITTRTNSLSRWKLGWKDLLETLLRRYSPDLNSWEGLETFEKS